MDHGRSTGLVFQHIVLDLVGVCQLGTQTGVAVGDLQDVVLTAQSLHDGSSVHGVVCSRGSSGAVLSSRLGLVLGLGVELHLHALCLTAQGVEVQLHDEHPEDHIVQNEVQHAHSDVDRPTGLANAQGQVVQQEVDEAVGADGTAAQQVQDHKAGASQNGMDHKQDRSHEQEAELDGLGNAGNKGSDGGGDQNGFDLLTALGASGLVHGQAGTDQAEHLGDATSVPDDGLAQHGNGRISDLSVVDVAGTLQHLAAHGGSAAQRSVQERHIDQMVQTGGDQQTLQHTVNEQTKVACALDKAAQGVDASLCKGPHKGEQHSQKHHDGDQHDEHKTGAAVDLEGVVELGLTEAVVHPCDHDAQQQAQEHAHVQHLDTQDHGLAGSGKTAFYQHAPQTHKFVHSVDEYEERKQGDQPGLRLFLICKANTQTNAENNAKIAQDRTQRTRKDRAKPDGDGIIQKWQDRLQPDVGE